MSKTTKYHWWISFASEEANLGCISAVTEHQNTKLLMLEVNLRGLNPGGEVMLLGPWEVESLPFPEWKLMQRAEIEELDGPVKTSAELWGKKAEREI